MKLYETLDEVITKTDAAWENYANIPNLDPSTEVRKLYEELKVRCGNEREAHFRTVALVANSQTAIAGFHNWGERRFG